MIEEYKIAIDKYIETIKSIPIDAAHEHTYRTPLENLINSIKFPTLNITPIHEGKDKKLDIDGTPDFFIYKDENTLFKTLIGFIECKKIMFNIDTIINSEQIAKYSKTSENIIITNYREFILFQKGTIQNRVKILLDDLSVNSDSNAYQNLINLFLDFYGYEYQYIKTKKSLITALASQSFYYSAALREYIDNKDNENEMFYYRFRSLFEDFQKSIQYHYELVDFCDIYAQSLVYGLLLSRLDTKEPLDETKRNYLDGIPDTYQLLYEFLESAYSNKFLPSEIKVALTNIGKNLNLINVESIQKEFDKISNGKSNIAVYLYEDFLKQYDELRKTEKRKEGGVYYTPKEATDFIVRGVNDLLKENFSLLEGFFAPNVKVLDFACGTGTFIDSIFDLGIEKDLDDLDKFKIKEKIINDFYGFEILFTPYIISHTILTKHLRDKGIKLSQSERLGIYLTNTLDISQHSISGHLPNLKKEHEKATNIKNKEDILAIVGNPPYFNGKSQSEKSVIDDELYKYKEGVNKRKTQTNNLYMKFIRFAEWKIEKTGYGIVGIITCNGWLDGDTQNIMRKHLYNTFDDIYIINLHGNTRKGDDDKNIFDIRVGVNITFFVKRKENNGIKRVFYYSTRENSLLSRAKKLEFLQTSSLEDINFVQLNPKTTENYWFVNKDLSGIENYKDFWKITNIFKEYNSGITSGNDPVCFSYTEKDALNIRTNILGMDIKDFEASYTVNKNWDFGAARDSLKYCSNPARISYRPFDFRYTFYTNQGFLFRARNDIMKHLYCKDNIGLSVSRLLTGNIFKHSFVVKGINEIILLSSKTSENNFVFPLYLYPDNTELFEKTGRNPNYTDKFIKEYLNKLSFQPTPEELLSYIYAVLHSSVYRTKYIEFLKTDFPAIPMTQNQEIFEKYAKEGQKLIDVHLMNKIVDDKSIKVSFDGTVSNFVITNIIEPSATESVLSLITADNKNIKFEGVTQEIYNFEIGSYRPIDKWLKYRKQDHVILNIINDVMHIKNMALAIKETIKIMAIISSYGEDYLK